jgi:hypothetical protein
MTTEGVYIKYKHYICIMEKEFIPYELALRMKALHFNENCYRVGNPNGAICWRFMDVAGVEGVGIDDILQVEFDERWVQIPTFSQAFRWFRKEYNLSVSISLISIDYFYDIRREGEQFIDKPDSYKTYEEAELHCLQKLIEIVESK